MRAMVKHDPEPRLLPLMMKAVKHRDQQRHLRSTHGACLQVHPRRGTGRGSFSWQTCSWRPAQGHSFQDSKYSALTPLMYWPQARHRARFLQLADVFLASGMVPAYTAAAFAKRLARLALRAPPAGE